MLKRYRLRIIFFLLGTLGGYLILHPYSMLVYAMIHRHTVSAFRLHWGDLSMRSIAAFEPLMLPMGIAFSAFGGIIGLLVGVIVEKAKNSYVIQFEHEKQKIALETLHQLMVTLAHYLLNANMIIGGKVRHCQKATSLEEVQESLAAIEEQGRKIDAVIRSLRRVSEVKSVGYTSEGGVKMIDITKEMEEELHKG